MKRRNNKGFTLIEMLIVVGIIAVLVAVSIPMVNSSLEKARIATDAANERAAKAAALTMYLNGDLDTVFSEVEKPEIPYDAANGRLFIKEDGHIGNVTNDKMATYGKCEKHRDKYVAVFFTSTGEIEEIRWQPGYVKGHGIDAENPLK